MTLHFKIRVYFKQTILELLNIKICQPLDPLCNPWPGTLELQVCVALWVCKGVTFCFRMQGKTAILASFRCQLLTYLRFDKFLKAAKHHITKFSISSITRPSFLWIRQESSFHVLGLWLFWALLIQMGTEMDSNPRPEVLRLQKFGQTYRRANIFY